MMKCDIRCWYDAVLRHDQYGSKHRSCCSFPVGFISEDRNNFGRGTHFSSCLTCLQRAHTAGS